MPIVGPLRVPSGYNPNWPLVDIAVSFSSGPYSSMPANYWCSLKARTLGQLTTNRGRQYELDQVQTGTWAGSLENTDSALDPANSASPFYPQVLPYRAFRHRMQYPATVNLLTADQATAFYSSRGSYSGSSLPQWVGSVTGSTVMISSAGSFNYYSVSAAAAYNTVAFYGFSVTPGLAYSGQCEANCSTGVTAEIALRFVDVNGNTISTFGGGTTTSASGAVITVTATAPANAAGAVLYVQNNTAVGGGAVFNVWDVQVEQNSTASAFATPGAWYSVFTGYVERWPQSWAQSGMFGTSDIVVVDAFGFLSQRKLLSSAYMEMLNSLNPSWLYPLDEASGLTFYDLTAQLGPITTSSYPHGSGGVTAGTSLPGNAPPYGISGPVVSFANSTSSNSIEVVDLGSRGGTYGPPSSGSWTRIFAFQMTAPLSHSPGLGRSYLWFCSTGDFLQALDVTVDYNPATGAVDCNWSSAGFSGSPGGTLATSISQSGWHLVAISIDRTNSELTTIFDGGAPVVTPLTSFPNFYYPGLDVLGGDDWQTSFDGFTGNMALAAELPYAISAAQFNQLWSVFNYGGSGLGVASSYSRYNDILRWGNWNGLRSVDNYLSGETVAYGPATEMNASAGSNGTDVVTMLQTVVDTDAGAHYVAADGTITFKARRARYNQGTPVVTFGEDTAAGEVPYTLVKTGYDPSRIANDISVVQAQTSVAVRATSSGSASQYGDIQLQRNVNTLDAYEQSDAAQYLLLRNSQPVQRVEGVSVDVGANPALWSSLLLLELGARVRVMRRPPLGAATIQVDGFVEQINWTFDNKGHASVDLQISVNNHQQYWQLDSSTYSLLQSTTIIGY